MFKRGCACLLLLATLVFGSVSTLLAQGGGAISGTVVDSAGGAIPGAAVTVKNESGASFEAVTNGEGAFNVPAVSAGAYKVSVALSGFKTAVADVVVQLNTPTAVKIVLEVGAITETINVSSSSELINTQTPVVAATLNADQLNRMPTASRNAINAVTFLPGINTAGINRDSTINGLPESMVQITMDGVSNNDNFLRSSDSFFASVSPRQDAVEAVTVVMAGGGANVGGSGAISINFQTRSGTNRFSGTAYEYMRRPAFNTNNWINERNGEPKNEIKLDQYGARAAGPVVIPGLYDGRGKMFYMANYEQLRFPNSFTETRTIINPIGLDGTFRYLVGANNEVREVNVLQLAANNGQLSTIDPTVMGLLNRIQAASKTTGTVAQNSDPMTQSYIWQSPGRLFEHQPTVRVDYNLSDNHRLSGSYAQIWATRDPDYLNNSDARFPGAPNYELYTSNRPLYSGTLRSTLSSNIVNELRLGLTAVHGSSNFGEETNSGASTFVDQGGYAIDFDSDIGQTNWHTSSAVSWRAAPTYELSNNLTWQRGPHSVNMGGSFMHVSAWEKAQTYVPGIQLGFDTNNDPAASLFATNANIPGASTAQLTDARQLYGLLTGRVTSVTGQAALDPDTNKYVAFGPRTREGKIDMTSLFVQDSWRVTPTLTLNGGLRWDLQLPFTAGNDTMSAVEMSSVCGISGFGDGSTYDKCNFNSPGTNSTAPTQYVQLSGGTKGYETDWNNVAPNIGIAWRPDVQGGFMRTILGDPDQATFRAGYSEAYERQGMGIFTALYGGNPGSTVSLTRNASTGLVPDGESWPVLLSQKDRLYPATFPESPTYPIATRANRADALNAFASDIKIGRAQTWTVSFQRSITRDMAVDVRYVGTRGSNQWSTLNYNGRQIEGNGFYEEFLLGVENLRANNASGVTNRKGSIAYFGPGTGTCPLPIYLAYLNGRTNAGDASAYTGTSWVDSAITGDLVQVWPDPFASATDLDNNLTRRNNAIAAGLAPNFFVVNPAVAANLVTDSGAFSDYHALQVDLRRRLSRGLSASVNYQYAIERGSSFLGFKYGREMRDAPNVRHAIKTQWDWTIPVGRGQRFGADMHPILDGILGGWSMNGVGRIQANTVNFGNVRLVGMTQDELQSMYKHEIKINPANGLETVYMLPDDVILNTRRAYSVDATTTTGYSALGVPEGRYLAPPDTLNCIQKYSGQCAPSTLLIRAPWFTRFDIGVTKKFPIKGSMNFEVRADVLNLFDNINFDNAGDTSSTATRAGSGAGIFQTTGIYDDPSNTYDPGGRLGQLMFRFNW